MKIQNYTSKFKTFNFLVVLFTFTFYLLTFFTTFILLLFHSFTPISAQEGALTVAPARQILQVNPGDTATFNVKFLNQASVPISGVFGVADFIVTDKSGAPEFLDSPTGASSRYAAASWVTLPFTRGTITAQDQLNLQLTVAVPENALPGGRYFGVYFEPTSSIPAKTGFEFEAGTGIQTRLAGLVYLRIAGPVDENALVSVFKAPRFVEYGPVNVATEILNRGSYHITPNAYVTLFDMLGRKIDTRKLEEVNIFPNAARSYVTELGSKYLFGKFTLKLNAAYGEGGKIVTAQTTFWAFPVRLVLAIILTIVIIALVTIIIYRGFKGKQKKLEEKLKEEISEIETLKEKYSDKVTSPLTEKRGK